MRINKSLITLASGGTASTVPWSGVTGTPTTLSGYGITDAVPSSRTLTINGTAYDLSANRTWSVGSVTSIALATGTTGTDVNVSGSPITSSGTITLNIPNASATARGLVTTGTQTIAGIKTFNDGIETSSTNGIKLKKESGTYATLISFESSSGSSISNPSGYASIGSDNTNRISFFYGGLKSGSFDGGSLTNFRVYTLPDANGTIALVGGSGVGTVTSVALATGTSGTDVNVSGSPITSSGTITLNIPSASASNRGVITTGTQTIAGQKTFTGYLYIGSTSGSANHIALQSGTSGYTYTGMGYVSILSKQANYLTFVIEGLEVNFIGTSLTSGQTYTLPNASGTLALTSSLSGYVPTSTTLTINDVAYDLSANRSWSIGDYGTW